MPNIWATFVRKFVTKYRSNLVTLTLSDNILGTTSSSSSSTWPSKRIKMVQTFPQYLSDIDIGQIPWKPSGSNDFCLRPFWQSQTSSRYKKVDPFYYPKLFYAYGAKLSSLLLISSSKKYCQFDRIWTSRIKCSLWMNFSIFFHKLELLKIMICSKFRTDTIKKDIL